MDDERITLRMGTEEIQAMDSFLEEHPELGSRSQFIRTALREYINRDVLVEISSDKKDSGIFVRLGEVQMNTLAALKEKGYCVSEEEFIRMCLYQKLFPQSNTVIQNTFESAQNEVLTK